MAAAEQRACVVTGASSGIGRATAVELARRGFRLGLLCRDRGRGEDTLREIRQRTGSQRAELVLADLACQAEIRRAAAEILERFPRLQLLVNNAGVFHTRFETTPDGIESVFAVNHLAYFLLTRLLLERLRRSAPARIVNVASDAHRFGGFDLDDLEFRRRRYAPMRVYGASKYANLLFTHELAKRLSGTGVTANALHPGGVNTRLGDDNGRLLALLGKVVKVFLRSPERGARTSVWLASAPEVEGRSGEYWADGRPHPPLPGTRDDEAARRLWEISERMTGLAPAG